MEPLTATAVLVVTLAGELDTPHLAERVEAIIRPDHQLVVLKLDGVFTTSEASGACAAMLERVEVPVACWLTGRSHPGRDLLVASQADSVWLAPSVLVTRDLTDADREGHSLKPDLDALLDPETRVWLRGRDTVPVLAIDPPPFEAQREPVGDATPLGPSLSASQLIGLTVAHGEARRERIIRQQLGISAHRVERRTIRSDLIAVRRRVVGQLDAIDASLLELERVLDREAARAATQRRLTGVHARLRHLVGVVESVESLLRTRPELTDTPPPGITPIGQTADRVRAAWRRALQRRRDAIQDVHDRIGRLSAASDATPPDTPATIVQCPPTHHNPIRPAPRCRRPSRRTRPPTSRRSPNVEGSSGSTSSGRS